MFQPTEPLARELAKVARDLRQKLGGRRLAPVGQEQLPGEQEQRATEAPFDATPSAPGTDTGSGAASLLWPPGRSQATMPLYEDSIRDLDLRGIAATLSAGAGKDQREYVTRILCELCDDPEVIGYRQDVVADMLAHPRLAAGFEELLSELRNLSVESMPSRQTTELFQITWWLGVLETYVNCIRTAADLFRQAGDGLQSEALRAVRDRIVGIEAGALFQQLQRELPKMLSRIRGLVSITVGINLDPDLQPEAATLLAVNDHKFTEAPLLKALLGTTAEHEAVMPIHSVPVIRLRGSSTRLNPMLVPLFRDLSRILEETTKPIATALRHYVDVEYGFLTSLEPDLAYYVGAANLIRRVEAGGFPMCRPELLPGSQRVTEARDSYNLNLALQYLDAAGEGGLKGKVVQNDVALNSRGRVTVLTGPNRGGKTTYVQGIGLVQVLCQAGLYVPGTRARISPADNVFTHFPIEEELNAGRGRFGDEAQRLGEIFRHATSSSLILLNEALSATYAGESLYLARDVVQILSMLGVRALYATHMHELAVGLEALNAQIGGESPVISMVASRIDAQVPAAAPARGALERSYRVVESPPMGRSYAHELAMSYGISFDQLVDSLRRRGLLNGSDPAATQPLP